MSDELWRSDAVDIVRGVRTRQFSAREATASCLERLDEVNPVINAVVDVLKDEALAAADQADQAVKEGKLLGPLHGVPVTVKINTDYAGRATTNGVVAFKDLISPEDSVTVECLRQAGAVIIGRTNVPAFSTRFFTDNALHGRTLNPWDSSRTPGGSSGGAAAAVAAGIGPIGHGNDRAGSVRYPAYACGVTGLRPTLGRVPNFNPSAKQERGLFSQITSVQGPMARSIADLRLGLEALTAYDIRDPWSVRMPQVTQSVARPVAVAMLAPTPSVDADPAVAKALDQTAQILESAGYRVAVVTPPHMEEASALFWSLMLSEEGMIADKSGASSASSIDDLGDEAVIKARHSTMANAKLLEAGEFVHGLARRTTILRDWLHFLENYPLILMPVSWQLPFPCDHDQQGDEALGQLVRAHEPMTAVSLLGLPGLAVPTGTSNGVPVGVQLVANRFQEELCLAAGEVIEANCPMETPVNPRH
jgi:amidase